MSMQYNAMHHLEMQVYFLFWKVSTTPATRLDVISLQEQLDMRLHQRQARETGICPIRRQLYTQCFGNII